MNGRCWRGEGGAANLSYASLVDDKPEIHQMENCWTKNCNELLTDRRRATLATPRQISFFLEKIITLRTVNSIPGMNFFKLADHPNFALEILNV